MTVDSSALIAVLFAEPGHLDLVDRILDADHVRIGAPTLVETSLVFVGRRAHARRRRGRGPREGTGDHGGAASAKPNGGLRSTRSRASVAAGTGRR